MPRRSQTATSGVLNPNLTPLLDVVLQLITFFMMLVHFGTRIEGATKAIRLPVVPAALPTSDLTFDRLMVTLDAEGHLMVGNESLDDRAATMWWTNQAKLRRAGLDALSASNAAIDNLPTLVVFRADREASYGVIRRTLAQAQEAGFVHFSLVTLRKTP